MDIEIIEQEERRIRFVLRNSSPAMANALRRTLLSDLPKMAIDKVEFHLGPIMDGDKEYESTTPLFDEIIAHRLGMVPVPTDLDLFVPQEECSCGGHGCPNCTIMYSLNKHGPCTVLSGDLMPLGNPDLKVKDEFIPLVELTDGQAVMIYAIAVMGTAKKHVKWQICNGVGYTYYPRITIDPAKAGNEEMLDLCAACPKKVFAVQDDKLVVNDLHRCNLCMSCIEAIGEDRGLAIEGDDSNFIFKFETDGSLTARGALDEALKILAAEANDFSSQLEALAQ